MGDWDVVSTAPAQGSAPAGEWDVVSTAPARPRRGPRAPNGNPTTATRGPGSTPQNPIPYGGRAQRGQYIIAGDGTTMLRGNDGVFRRVELPGVNARPAAPRTAAAPQGSALAYGQYGLQGAQDSVSSQSGAIGGMVNPGRVFSDALNFAADTTDNIANLFNAATSNGPASPPPNALLPAIGPMRSAQAAATNTRRTGIDLPEARTAGERLAYFAGSAAPALALPGGATTTGALALGGGTLGGWGAGEWARANGLSPEGVQLAELGGGLVGGGIGAGLSGIRRVPGSGQPPTGIDPANPVPPQDAARAADYVQRQIPAGASPVVPQRGQTTAEASGRRAQVALGALARREGQTADALGGNIQNRRATRPDRMLGDFQRATGFNPADAQTAVETVVSAGRDRVRPMFQAVENDPTPVTSPRLTVLSETPIIQRALRAAYEDLANNPDGPQAGSVFREGPNGLTVAEPTMATWDKVYKALQGEVERNQFTGRPIPDTQSRGNFNVNRARAALRSELGRLSPQWGEAISAAGDYVPVEGAYNAGRGQILAGNVSARDVQTRVAGMSEGELSGYRAGIATRIFEQAQNGRLRPAQLTTPNVRAKLEAALGREATDELINAIGSEAAMAAFEQRYAPNTNSVTSDMNAAMAEQDNIGGSAVADGALNFATDALQHRSFTKAALNWAIGQARTGAAHIRTRGMSVGARNEAGRLLGGDMSPADARAYAERVRTQAAASRPRLAYVPPEAGNMLAPLVALPSASPRRTER